MVTFFSNGAAVNLDYKAIRDLPHNEPYRAFVEDLWARYKPSGDGNTHFLKDAKPNFRQRFWEMYLFCAMEDQGITVQKTSGKDGGPDFSFEAAGKKYWVEAIAPEAGNGNDKVPFPVLGAPNYAPRDLILLRYTHALSTKFKCWTEKWVDENIVSSDDGYIIAINGGAIPDADCSWEYPYIIQSLYPVGPFAVKVDRNSLAFSEPYLLREELIKKQSGELINSAPLIDKKYSAISAVIHSFAGPSRCASPLGYDFLLLRNPCAQHPLPIGSLSWCTQYSFQDRELTRTEPSG
ncbi:MAG: hypothetical protein WBE80_14545 [Methylocella sp.]